MLIQIAISNSPLHDTYTYKIDAPVEPGERVEVNFAGRNTIGYVVSLEEKRVNRSLTLKKVYDQTIIDSRTNQIYELLHSSIKEIFN